jgi:hypothetical protein
MGFCLARLIEVPRVFGKSGGGLVENSSGLRVDLYRLKPAHLWPEKANDANYSREEKGQDPH